MPPLRLALSLRLCHPLGSATTARCASSTSSPSPSAADDESRARNCENATSQDMAAVPEHQSKDRPYHEEAAPGSKPLVEERVATETNQAIERPKPRYPPDSIQHLWIRFRYMDRTILRYSRALPAFFQEQTNPKTRRVTVRKEPLAATWNRYQFNNLELLNLTTLLPCYFPQVKNTLPTKKREVKAAMIASNGIATDVEVDNLEPSRELYGKNEDLADKAPSCGFPRATIPRSSKQPDCTKPDTATAKLQTNHPNTSDRDIPRPAPKNQPLLLKEALPRAPTPTPSTQKPNVSNNAKLQSALLKKQSLLLNKNVPEAPGSMLPDQKYPAITADDRKPHSIESKNQALLQEDAFPKSPHSTPSTQEKLGIASDSISESAPSKNQPSLLDELFPEAKGPIPSDAPIEKKTKDYPKLDPPNLHRPFDQGLAKEPLTKAELYKTKRAEIVEKFQQRMELVTVIQVAHCSKNLTEDDFMRLIPKGKHIEGWRAGGEFFKIIPGRDPLSLERLPFYYLLFRSHEAAIDYQKNAARLHALCASQRSTDIFSAVPAPGGFVEDGEDINNALLSYNISPVQHRLEASVLMQPYNPALRALFDRGGYKGVLPNVDERGQRIWKVLMHIEGYEPSPLDLYKIFVNDAWRQGMLLSLRTESVGSIHRLRDIVNLKTNRTITSVINPSAYRGDKDHTGEADGEMEFEDPEVQHEMGAFESSSAKEVNQFVMNVVYNRWVVDFDNETAARRFAITWHRRVLPATIRSKGAWEETEEERMCNTEVLW